MKRTLGNRHELGLILQADGRRAALAVDVASLSEAERALLTRLIEDAREVEFGAHPLADGRTRLEITVGHRETVEDGVKRALVQ